MTRLVSAEEARQIVATREGIVSDVDLTYRCAATVVALSEEQDDLRSQLEDAHDELRFTALAIYGKDADAHMLHEAAGEVVAERDRLRAILACERGGSAPEGWAFDHATCSWSMAGGMVVAFRVIGSFLDGSEPFIRWEWIAGRTFGAAPTALEAIEAADRAAAPK